MYQVGQIVKVVNQKLDTYGMIGEIVDVDETWAYPYEIKFKEDINTDQELYSHSDVQVYIGDSVNKKVKSIEDAITDLIILVATEGHTRENALTLTKLQEARMWYVEGKKINNKGDK